MRPDGTSHDELRRLEDAASQWCEMIQDPEKARELLRAMGILTADNEIADPYRPTTSFLADLSSDVLEAVKRGDFADADEFGDPSYLIRR